VAVADVKGVLDNPLGFLRGHLKDAKAQLWNLDAVVQGDAGNGQRGHFVSFAVADRPDLALRAVFAGCFSPVGQTLALATTARPSIFM
jgi:hypothetical protein